MRSGQVDRRLALPLSMTALLMARLRSRLTARMHASTKKIVKAASRIAKGELKQLRLGNIDIQRDWGWAPEYVEAMFLMLQQEKPADYVIATGEKRPLRDFVAAAFQEVGLDWREHTVIDPSLFRPTDLTVGHGNPTKAALQLGWKAKYHMTDVARMMVEAEEPC
jgi:GDPmannose 4,6-dehydratase